MAHGSEDTITIRPIMHHINLKTGRLQEMIDWYGTVVGMKPNYQFPGGAGEFQPSGPLDLRVPLSDPRSPL